MPASETSQDSPRSLYESYLPRIDRIIGSAARRLALAPDEADDFRSWVHLRLIEDGYRTIARFGGRSSLATYLTAVIQNLARDYRIREWGRWRPSAAAERLGVAAVQLEILIERDGFSLDEAIEALRANHNVRLSRSAIAELAGQLPPRVRARLEGGEKLAEVAGRDHADETVRRGERTMTLKRAKEALDRSLAGLELTDRLLLRLHYESGLTISAVARALGLAQRELYTRRDRCLRALRRGLEAAGLEGVEVIEALGWKEAELEIEYAAEEAEADPSNRAEPPSGDEP